MEARSFGNKTPSQYPRSLLRSLQHFYCYYDLVPARQAGRHQLIHYSRGLHWSHYFWINLLDRICKTDANTGLEDWWSSNRSVSSVSQTLGSMFDFCKTNSWLIYPNRTRRRNPMDIFRGSYPPTHLCPQSSLYALTRSSSEMINLHFLLTLSPWTHSATAEPASQPGLINGWRNAKPHRRLYNNGLISREPYFTLRGRLPM